jgi:predicted alpha/beta hydrolase
MEYLDRGSDRLALHVYDGGSRPVVVVWPAMGVPARYYRPFVGELDRVGLDSVVVDLRGTGASEPRPTRRSAYGYAELAGDVGAVLDALRSRLDGRPTVLLGHSLGGQMCLLHLARHGGAGVSGLVLVAVGLPWYRLYPGTRSAGVLAMTQGIAVTSAALRVWPGWGFGGRQARGVIRDWAYTARHGRFPDDSLAGVRTPVLAISVDGDRYTPAATTDHLCAMLSGAPVERVHESGETLDHFAWVRASGSIPSRVARFVNGTPV